MNPVVITFRGERRRPCPLSGIGVTHTEKTNALYGKVVEQLMLHYIHVVVY